MHVIAYNYGISPLYFLHLHHLTGFCGFQNPVPVSALHEEQTQGSGSLLKLKIINNTIRLGLFLSLGIMGTDVFNVIQLPRGI